MRVRHLLSHTAGFEDKPVVSAFSRTAGDIPDLEEALIQFMPERAWEPGRYTAYSNYSTALAAQLVAEVSGMSWEQYLEDNIFQPLGMTRTSARQPIPGALTPGLTKVYGNSEDRLAESAFEFSMLAPAGGIVTTSQDMGRFMLAHLQQGRLGDERILQEATVDQMHSQLFTHDPRLPGNAHGFWETQEHGTRILSHAGDLNTAHTLLAIAPEHDLGLYVDNSFGGVEARAELWKAFWEYALPQTSPTPPETAAGFPGSVDRFAGSYGVNRVSTTTMAKLFKLLAVLTVTAEDENLVTEAPGVEQQRWVQVAENEFAEVEGPGRMILGEDDAGAITHIASTLRR